MTDVQRKALKEYLGEPYATSEYTVANNGDLVSVRTVIGEHSFTTDADMMALYRAIYKEKRWTEFFEYSNNIWWINYGRSYDTVDEALADYNAWLFCLEGKDYEDRCCLVAEWLEEVK